jgi:hypothetical protein
MNGKKSATKRPAKKTTAKPRRRKATVKSTKANAFARRVGVRRRTPKLARKPRVKAAPTP